MAEWVRGLHSIAYGVPSSASMKSNDACPVSPSSPTNVSTQSRIRGLSTIA